MDKFLKRKTSEETETEECNQPKKVAKPRSFCDSWLQLSEFRDWLEKKKDGDRVEAYCKICNICLKLSSGKSDLQKHMKSTKHLEKEKLVSKSKNIAECFHANTSLQNNVTKAELKMCALIVEHDIAILTADHMGKFFKSAFPDSKIASVVKCGRTKATALIQNVLGKEQFNSLCQTLNKNKFSICADESTDVSCKKVLSIVARICQNFKTNDFHLCILEVESSTSDFLYNAIKSFFENHNINYKDNLIGFAADGANNMTGINNSVASLMKRFNIK